MPDPATIAAASGFLEGVKEFNPSSRSGDAFSGSGPVDANFSTGDIFLKSGGKDSILTIAIVAAAAIILMSIYSKKKK